MLNNSSLQKYSFAWVTLSFFLLTLVGHWTAAWYSFKEEQKEHNQPIEVNNYFTEVFRDTMENWQSEFLQLMWQVAGLTYFLYIGSPQSKEGDDRKEEKLDEILKLLSKKESEKIIKKLDKKYPKQ